MCPKNPRRGERDVCATAWWEGQAWTRASLCGGACHRLPAGAWGEKTALPVALTSMLPPWKLLRRVPSPRYSWGQQDNAHLGHFMPVEGLQDLPGLGRNKDRVWLRNCRLPGMTRFTCGVSRSITGLSLPAHFKDDIPEKRSSGVGRGQRPRAGDPGVGVWAGGCPKALLALACYDQLDCEGQRVVPEGGPLGPRGPADGLRTGHCGENCWAMGT
ncbi:uncharacterized protein LOC123939748 [Meles meles]|uniref:uncharacterized protein LOC123939748 n=1 Tax=Meles meles TaxID=9662 RepID=UPI001E698934|nr:uncharacterized protein LOC123939748 [Meles meles]